MKRITALFVLLAVLAFGAPASAATWRSLGTAKAAGNAASWDSAWAGLEVMTRDAKTVQLGVWQNSGTTRRFEYDYYISAYNDGGGSSSKSGDPGILVPNRTWKWVTVWNKANSWDSVSVDADAYRSGYGSHYQRLQLKVRVK